jgi:adenine phosphoribosyltransferase
VELNRDLYIRLKFLSMLSACSWKLTQKGISESIGISSTTASKYVNGVFLPSTKRAQKLMAELSEICSMESLLKEALSSGPLTYPEVLNVTSKDVSLILWASLELLAKVKDLQFEKILTVEGGGTVIGSIMASIVDVSLVYGLRNSYVEGSYAGRVGRALGKYSSFVSIPKGALRRGERVLIVDDVMSTGKTISALKHIGESARARVVGIGVLAVQGNSGLKKFKNENLHYLVSL